MIKLGCLAAVCALGLGLVACSGDKVMQAATSGPAATPPPAAAAAKPDAGAPAVAPAPKMEFAENDFAENDRNRDPFRTFAAVMGVEVKKIAAVQREVMLPQFSIDELKLVAIVTGGDYPRAMMVDPTGKGWVLKRGDWIGRPEVVHVGGANGADYNINWRVDKVRDGDIVFKREDPAQPGIPAASRVVALRPEGSENPREKL